MLMSSALIGLFALGTFPFGNEGIGIVDFVVMGWEDSVRISVSLLTDRYVVSTTVLQFF